MMGVSAGVTVGFHVLINQFFGSLIPLQSGAVYATSFALPHKAVSWAIRKIPNEYRNNRDGLVGGHRWNLVISKVILATACFFGNVANAQALTNLIFETENPITYSTALTLSSLATAASIIYEYFTHPSTEAPPAQLPDLNQFQNDFDAELDRRLDRVGNPPAA
jgi:hypothetical protein